MDILFQAEKVERFPSQFAALQSGVAAVLDRRSGRAVPKSWVYDEGKRRLAPEEIETLMEVFWDLVVDKVITIGFDHCNCEFPWFRIHSSMRDKGRAEVN